MKKLFFLLIGLAFIAFSCQTRSDFADGEASYPENFVTEKTAKSLLTEVFEEPVTRSDGKTAFSKISKTTPVYGADQLPLFYVMNYEGGGFVLLSADNRIEPVLAYSEENEFPMEELDDAPGIKMWFEDISIAIEEIKSRKEPQPEYIAAQWEPEAIRHFMTCDESDNDEFTHIETRSSGEPGPQCTCDWSTKNPITESKDWHQGADYNIRCPLIGGVRAQAGCHPIAMARVMYHHKKPPVYDFDLSHANNWNGIYQLVADCGYVIGAVYGTQETSAYMSEIMPAFKNYFGYRSAVWRGDINLSIVKSNINSNRPVYLRGRSNTSGHAWITDGYKTFVYCVICYGIYAQLPGINYLYMKWGWGNMCDGWFRSDPYEWNPTTTHSYNNNREMVHDIYY